ncbi:MAG: hypothetical protein K2L87_07100 [Clostridiales bacterium]|nr:hypothetical protein [Clostridiales bacterium]
MEEERDEGVSIGELIHAVLKKIWWILGISALVTIIALLGTVFVINPGKVVYEVCFTIDYPEKSDLKYPDGSAFRYLDLIGLENLEKAKASNEKFKNIDIDALNAGNGLTIQEKKREISQDEDKIIPQERFYILQVKGSYFSDRAQANDFVRALVNVPVENIKDLIEKMDFYVSLNAYKNVSTYEERIASLKAQKNFLLERYDLLIKFLGEDYEVSYTEGETQITATLRAMRSDASLSFNALVEESFRTELKNNQYLFDKSEDSITRIQIQIADKNLQIKQNSVLLEVLERDRDTLIEKLGNASSSAPIGDSAIGDYTTRINDLIAKNNTLQQEIEILEASLTGGNNPTEFEKQEQDFSRRLDAEWQKLNNITANCKQVALALYDAESKAQFETAGVYTYENGYSVMFVSVGSFIVTFLVVAIIICLIDIPKYRKQKLAGSDGKAEEPVEEATEEEKKED